MAIVFTNRLENQSYQYASQALAISWCSKQHWGLKAIVMAPQYEARCSSMDNHKTFIIKIVHT